MQTSAKMLRTKGILYKWQAVKPAKKGFFTCTGTKLLEYNYLEATTFL